ncbi:MAG: GMC family oxidoreductase, partial [Gammaproteobacteria bacterium]|nr:GMC family oxidoreductase [Gammaproteobacteria bacterium]
PLPYAPRPTVLDLRDGHYVQDGPATFGSTYERRVGGTTWHWQGTAMRWVPSDFRLRTLHGVGHDWPIDYDQLEPWYAAAEKEIGVAGNSEDDLDSPRSTPYPLPPIPPSYVDRRIDAALRPRGLRVRLSPHARNSVPFQDRPPCCGSNTCVPICPVGAKYDAAVHARLAERAGARILDRAIAHRIGVDAQGRVTAIAFKRPDGSEHEAIGSRFVIAAHGIETPRLLLMSRSDRLPDGVANSSGQVGRNLMDHPVQVSLALARDPVYPYRGPGEISGIEHMRDGEFRSRHGAFRMPIGNDGWSFGGETVVGLAEMLIAEGRRGRELRDALAHAGQRQVRLAALLEQLPDPDNRVTLADERDALGLPRPKLTYSIDDYTLAARDAARRLADVVFDGLDATRRTHVESLFGAGHIMGTYRMGTDPKISVVDPFGRSHDHPNLFLAGSGVFPTGATANPTLTLAALALRTAAEIVEEATRAAETG